MGGTHSYQAHEIFRERLQQKDKLQRDITDAIERLDEARRTIATQQEERESNFSPGVLASTPGPSNAPPAYPGSTAPTQNVLMDVGRNICIDHDIQIKLGPDGGAVASGTAEILNMMEDYKLVFLVDTRFDRDERRKEAREVVTNLMRVVEPYLACHPDIVFTSQRKGQAGSPIQTRLFDVASVSRVFASTKRDNFSSSDLPSYLQGVITDYMQSLAGPYSPKGPKRLCLIVITDCWGIIAEELQPPLIKTGKYLKQEGYPPEQIGVEFVSLSDDVGGTHGNRFNILDNQLAEKYGIHDFIDWTPYKSYNLNAATIIKILLGSIDRRIDKGLVTQAPAAPAAEAPSSSSSVNRKAKVRQEDEAPPPFVDWKTNYKTEKQNQKW